MLADCGFTSRASVAALAVTGVPFILGFARSAPIRRLAALVGSSGAACATAGRSLGCLPLGRPPQEALRRARTPTDQRGPRVYVTNLRSVGPRQLAVTYRRRWRAEQAIEELHNGHDLDHLVSTRLHPNQIAVGFRLLARNLAIGQQIHEAQARPEIIREPRAFRVTRWRGSARSGSPRRPS